MPQKYVPNDTQLIKMAAEAVKNATAKQDAAAKLLEAGGDPSTAFAVAALGMEELGKSFLCSYLLALPSETLAKAAPFMLGNHVIKMHFASTVIRVFVDEADLPADPDALFEQITTAATTTNDTKFQSLYVDAEDDGVTIRTPDATASDARALVVLLDHAISVLTDQNLILDGTEDPAVFRTYMNHLNRNRAQAEQLIEADPIAAFGGFRALARGEDITPEWLIALAPPEVAEQLK